MLTTFEYRCLANIVLGKLIWSTVASKDQDKFDEKDREAMMLIKLSVT
jgi:hypothetical protein